MDITRLPTVHEGGEKKRCCRRVSSTGTSPFKGDNKRCGGVARYYVDGVNLCPLHAGEAALKYVLTETELNDKALSRMLEDES